MEEEVKGVQYIPKDAQIPIQIGSAFLQRLQKLLLFILEDKTDEDLAELTKHVTNQTIPEDSWMYHYQTLQILILTIEQTAIDKNLIVTKDE